MHTSATKASRTTANSLNMITSLTVEVKCTLTSIKRYTLFIQFDKSTKELIKPVQLYIREDVKILCVMYHQEFTFIET